ncbi:hypothetical protein [Adhaeretor mobilis]|uniref:hypothetical protein n=1 Tax=Adhaeretor mobilis TaxID=1930276 RepID=UPI001C54DB1B|nr:hypothetical protein [Adhaeretor mobilis]
MQAAGKAQKAADWMFGTTFEEVAPPQEPTVTAAIASTEPVPSEPVTERSQLEIF